MGITPGIMGPENEAKTIGWSTVSFSKQDCNNETETMKLT
jgi:hypothetical protein